MHQSYYVLPSMKTHGCHDLNEGHYRTCLPRDANNLLYMPYLFDRSAPATLNAFSCWGVDVLLLSACTDGADQMHVPSAYIYVLQVYTTNNQATGVRISRMKPSIISQSLILRSLLFTEYFTTLTPQATQKQQIRHTTSHPSQIAKHA